MDLTFDECEQLGCTCPREMFKRCKMEAESALAQIENTFTVVWNTPESEVLAFIALIDEAFNSDTIFASGGQVTSIKVGSYSESRSAGSTATGAIGRSREVLGRFARLYQKKIGVVRR